MTEIATTNGQAGAVVSAEFNARFRAGIGASRAATPRAGGMNILRLLKEGTWVYGPEAIEVEEGSTWCLNTYATEHGYVCWSRYEERGKKDEILGEKMASIGEDKPLRPQPIQGFEWTDQRNFVLKCLDGEDAGAQVIYKVTSIGGLNEADKLLASIEKQMNAEEVYVCPVVTLEVDFYQHPKYGRTFTPVVKLVDWADINGATKPAQAAAPAKAAVKAVEAKAEPAETVAAEPAATPARARRRPR